MKKQALISVFDKTGVEDFAKGLVGLGYEILSTGGTFKELKAASIPVTEVSDITGFPEILEGRVKTLTPQVHAGILARRQKKEDMDTLSALHIDTIDVVAVNLYPFFEKVADDSLTFEEKVEFIDIGGPTMLRSAAKNFADVVVVSDPADYATVLDGLSGTGVSFETRKHLAAKVFALTSAYDASVQSFLSDETFPEYYTVSYKKAYDLRYGENPHQQAAYYIDTVDGGSLGTFDQLNGKELSYNNLRDLEAAWQMVSEFDIEPFVVAVKHNTPCGAALGSSIEDAYDKAYRCDSTSIFGGIVAVNGTVDKGTAEKMNGIFLEIVAALDFTSEALEILCKKKNLRVLKMKQKAKPSVIFSKVDGGLLVQTEDDQLIDGLNVVTKMNTLDQYEADILFGLKIVKYVKSNAIAIVKDGATLGLGGGQVNRIWPTIDALSRADEVEGKTGSLVGATMISDAFFPFSDCVEEANKYGIKMIVHPGGSINDQLSTDECDKDGICMAISGIRHFRH